MKKLLILSERPETAAMEEGALSWPRRELGADVCYYADSDVFDRVLYLGLRLATFQGVVVYRSTLNRQAMLSIPALKALRDTVRLVHWCSESAHPDYQPLLAEYKRHECFDFTVGTDGGQSTELVDWNTLWPVDPQPYEKQVEKDIRLGFSGSWSPGTPRARLLEGLGDSITLRKRGSGPYQEHVDFMLRCRATVNYNECGKVVNGRPVEAALAGCLLFEPKRSPLGRWLTPMLDYVEYQSPSDVREWFRAVEGLGWNVADKCSLVGQDTGNKARSKYHPKYFWHRVMGD